MKWNESHFRSPCCFCVVFLFSSLNAQEFRNPHRISTAQDPVSVFTADVNGDGVPDLIYETETNSTAAPSTINIQFGQALGGYIAGPTLTPPSNVGGCRPVDVNRDGKIDLVCLEMLDVFDMSIATFLGNGNGTFQAPIYSAPMQSSGFFDFEGWIYAPADVNGDGIPDLFVGDAMDQWIFVLIGDGSGRFTVKSILGGYPVAESSGFHAGTAMSIRVADVNGDGKADLLFSGGPTVLLGNDDGTFTSPQLVANSSVTRPYLQPWSVLDINKDGRDDVVTTDASHIYSALSNGDGSFTTATTAIPTNSYGASPSFPVFADFSDSGKQDAAYGLASSVQILKGHGDGTFDSTGVNLAVPAYQGKSPNTASIKVATGDFDGDGNQDITALAEINSQVAPWTNLTLTVVYVSAKAGWRALSSLRCSLPERQYPDAARPER